MEFIGEIYERDFYLEEGIDNEDTCYKVRKAARSLVFDSDNKIAVLYVSKKGYYKLPGGGIESGEDVKVALVREIEEETGCKAAIRQKEVGMTIEYRNTDGLLQVSYCYLSDVVGDKKEVAFTEREISNGFQLQWLDLDEVVDLLGKSYPSEMFEKFIVKRDLVFLKKAREILS